MTSVNPNINIKERGANVLIPDSGHSTLPGDDYDDMGRYGK